MFVLGLIMTFLILFPPLKPNFVYKASLGTLVHVVQIRDHVLEQGEIKMYQNGQNYLANTCTIETVEGSFVI